MIGNARRVFLMLILRNQFSNIGSGVGVRLDIMRDIQRDTKLVPRLSEDVIEGICFIG